VKTVLLLLCSAFLWATPVLTPVHTLEINGTAKDMVLEGKILTIATDAGHIEAYDTDTYQKIKEISIPDVKDFMGDIMPARVMSTDRFGTRYLLLSDSGIGGYSNLYLFDGTNT